MENLSLADRLVLIRFEVYLQRLPHWMANALSDAIRLAEAAESVAPPPLSSVESASGFRDVAQRSPDTLDRP